MPARRKPQLKEREEERSEPPALPLDARSRSAARAALALILFGLATWMATDFLPALAWAVVIAITSWPIYIRFAATVLLERQPAFVAPLAFTIITGIVLLFPLILALQQLGQVGNSVVQWLGQLQESGVPVPEWVSHLPVARDLLVDWWQKNLSDPHTAAQWLRGLNMDSLTMWTGAFGGELLHRVFLFVLTLIALFFIYRDGGWLAERGFATADRLLGDPGERLASKMSDAIRGIVNGTVVVAIVEGIIIGVGYGVVGAPDAVLLTILSIAFAMLPLGAEIAVSLVSLLLLVQGFPPLSVLALFVFGLAVTIIGDNFVWPALVGRAARLPFLMALIGVLGGVQTFGMIGLFIGPVVMAALLTIWREWISRKPP
jgi:predicted PurR-regulated permease PerM